MTLTRRVVIALATGLILGIAISASGSLKLVALASHIEVVGTLWVNAIRMTVIPLVVSLLITSVASASDVATTGREGGRALLLFIALLSASALFAALAAPPLFTWLPIDAAATSPPGDAAVVAAAAAEGVRKIPTFAQWLIELVPTNPIRAAADGAMLPLVIFSLLFAVACTRADQDLRQLLIRFFRAVSETMLILVRWIIWFAPIGVFALMLALAARTGASAVGAFGYYILVACALLFVQLLAMYPLVAIAGRVPVQRFAQAAFPAQAVAISSRSSLASLPTLIESAENRMGVPPVLCGFVLPVAVSTFKIGAPIGWIVGAVFTARLYGVSLAPGQIALIAAAAVLLSFTSPGIPSGGIIPMAPLFATVGLPMEGIGILIALDLIPDISRTVSNVTADMAVVALLARKSGVADSAPPNPLSSHSPEEHKEHY